jgi:hypothetical protein
LKNSVKFRKIRPKHDEGTVKIWNTEIQPVLPNYRPTSPINWQFFLKFVLAILGRILVETGRILLKIGQ